MFALALINVPSAPRFPNSVGNNPANIFSSSARRSSFTNSPSSDGRVPVCSLDDKISSVSDVRLPIAVGKVELRKLALTSKETSSLKASIVSGSPPVRLLLKSSKNSAKKARGKTETVSPIEVCTNASFCLMNSFFTYANSTILEFPRVSSPTDRCRPNRC